MRAGGLFGLGALLATCSSSPAPTTTTSPDTRAPAESAEPQSASTPPPAATTGSAVESGPPPIELTAYDGPHGKWMPPAVSRIWTVAPHFATDGSGKRVCSFDSVTFAPETDGGSWGARRGTEIAFIRMSDDKQTRCDFSMPNELTAAPRSANVGAAALVSLSENIARIGRVKKIADGKITVTVEQDGSPTDVVRAAHDVFALNGDIGFGAPVAYRNGDKWRAGIVATTTSEDTWVVENHFFEFQKVKRKDVRATPVDKPFAIGAKVWRFTSEEFQPGIVSAVLDGAVYEITVEGQKWRAPLEDVVAPL